MRLLRWMLIAMLAGFAMCKVAACEFTHECTAIGCSDGVFASVAFADHSLMQGAYRFEVTLDDAMHVCSFSWPEDQPPRGSVGSVRCEPSDHVLDISISQDAECTEHRTGDSVSQTCEPLDGKYTLSLSASGTPKNMRLRVERDGALVSERSLALTYSESRPNGPDCEPLCRQSHHKVQLD